MMRSTLKKKGVKFTGNKIVSYCFCIELLIIVSYFIIIIKLIIFHFPRPFRCLFQLHQLEHYLQLFLHFHQNFHLS